MKKGDIMMVMQDAVNAFTAAGRSWNDDGIKKGDLVVVMEPNGGDRVWRGARVAQILHPNVGVVYIAKHRLEVVDGTR